MKVKKVFQVLKALEGTNLTKGEVIIFDNKDHKINIGGEYGEVGIAVVKAMSKNFENITKQFKAEQKQIKLVYKLQKKGFNLVNCCNCGSVNLVKTVTFVEGVEYKDDFDCLGCGENVSANDCSDYLYQRY